MRLPRRWVTGSRGLPEDLVGTHLRRIAQGGTLRHDWPSAAYELCALAGDTTLARGAAVERGAQPDMMWGQRGPWDTEQQDNRQPGTQQAIELGGFFCISELPDCARVVKCKQPAGLTDLH